MRKGLAVFLVVASAVSALAQPSGGGVGNLLGIELDTGNLYRVNQRTAEVGLVGNTGQVGYGALEFSPEGVLYGIVTGSSPSLYRINPDTAETTYVTALSRSFLFEGGLAFGRGKAYAVNGNNADNAELLTLDLTTGAVTSVGFMGPADLNGLAFRPSDNRLIGLDRGGNRLVTIDPTTATLTTLTTLSKPVGSVGGMTVFEGVGYFNTSGPKSSIPGSNELYSFDLDSGLVTLVGSYPDTFEEGMSGLAAVPEPGTMLALGAGLAALAARRRRRSG